MRCCRLLLLLTAGAAALPAPRARTQIKCTLLYFGDNPECIDADAKSTYVYNYVTKECSKSFHACESEKRIIETDEDCRTLCEDIEKERLQEPNKHSWI